MASVTGCGSWSTPVRIVAARRQSSTSPEPCFRLWEVLGLRNCISLRRRTGNIPRRSWPTCLLFTMERGARFIRSTRWSRRNSSPGIAVLRQISKEFGSLQRGTLTLEEPLHAFDEGFHLHRAFRFFLAADADVHLASFRFLVTDDELERHLLHRVLANLG